MKKLYHGTISLFDEIDVDAGRGYKDFGKGFYATAILYDYYDELVENDFSEEICKRVISELKPENLPKQYFFRTEKAIETLSFGKIKRQVVG